jgi:hypothetical protein
MAARLEPRGAGLRQAMPASMPNTCPVTQVTAGSASATVQWAISRDYVWRQLLYLVAMSKDDVCEFIFVEKERPQTAASR